MWLFYTGSGDRTQLTYYQFLHYLCNESQHFHLASLMVGTEAPEELILRRVAVGHSSVVQVSEVRKKNLRLWAVCEKYLINLGFETL